MSQQRETFFKYHCIKTAKIILNDGTRRWASPSEFNDPFDNDVPIYLSGDIKLLAQNQLERFLAYLSSEYPIIGCNENPILAKYEWMRQNFKGDISKEIKHKLLKDHIEQIPEMRRKFNNDLDNIRRKPDDTALFCVSEINDNILMWSHYADNHTGVVIEFKCVDESPLTLAKPINYSKNFPVLEEVPIGGDLLTKKYLDMRWYTKSMCWAYEKEWRIASTHRDKSKTIEDLPFNKKELKAIYLGCKMSLENKKDIVELVKLKYPSMHVYEASKHSKKFALQFHRMNI